MEKLEILYLGLGICIGLLIGLFIFMPGNEISLKQEVGDDICFQLTGNESAEASTTDLDLRGKGKLVCELPSFDSTQNIIIKSNTEERQFRK